MKSKNLLMISGSLIFILGALSLIFSAYYYDWEKRYPECSDKLPKHLRTYGFILGGLLCSFGGLFVIWGWAHHVGHTHGTYLHVTG